MTVEPAPCPECSDDAPPEEAWPVYDHQTSGVALQCDGCGLRGSTVESMDDALVDWNAMVAALLQTGRGSR